MKMLIQWIVDTLGFSRTEAKGTLVLIMIILAFMVVPRIFIIQSNSDLKSLSTDQKYLKEWGAQLESFIKIEKKIDKPSKTVDPEPKTFTFNPNLATLTELESLGLGKYAAQNIISYRDAGGIFKVKADLKKIYGITAARVDELWGYIDLPEQITESKELQSKQSKKITTASEKEETTELKVVKKFDINLATAEQLQNIRGIGPAYSKRIIEYRDQLGGFRSPDQLFEVWGIKEESIINLIERVTFSSPPVLRNINTDSMKHLYTHPYIDYNTAKAIFNYRRQRGRLDSISQIREIKIIDDSLYQKIYPYLSIE